MPRRNSDTDREPCPDRIIDDTGGSFVMGALGGSMLHFVKGAYNAPRGERFINASQAVRMNALRAAGHLGIWGGLVSAFDCTFVYLRQKEDPWNPIMAGAAAGGFLEMRRGLGPVVRGAVFGGMLFALFEGLRIIVSKSSNSMEHENSLKQSMLLHEPVFKDGKSSSSSRQSEAVVLESFDAPPPPKFD